MDYEKIFTVTPAKEFDILDVFSIVDGRLAGNIEGVYEILNWIYDTSFLTHQLPNAMKYLLKKNPPWINNTAEELRGILHNIPMGKDNFVQIHEALKKNWRTFLIPQLEYDLEDFRFFMYQHDPLRNK